MITPLQKTLLKNRGFLTEESQEAFLNPDYRGLHNPFLMNDLEAAVDRIYRAIKEKERIEIFADYDCDGIPGSIILLELFKKVGHTEIEVYIPDRHTEGYGLNLQALDDIKNRGAKIVITVDLGISNKKEIAYGRNLGLEVIVTDHHEPPEELPEDVLIVHPKLGSYLDPYLSGAGVAFKLVQGFLLKYGKEFSIVPGWEKWLLDLAAFATLSDMVPLHGENRILSYYGMIVLKKTRRPGFVEMLRDLAINPSHVTEDDIYFSMAPRINAASRMDHPRRAFELLETEDSVRARESSVYLGSINDERKKIVTRIMKDVHTTLEARNVSDVIVIGNPSWRIGVLGLIASRIVEHYKKPAFVWGREGGDVIKGSCRSDGTVHVVEIMKGAHDTFLEYGGHEGAGGFAVSSEAIHLLEEKLVSSIANVSRTESKKTISIDAMLSIGDVTERLYQEIMTLSPFGVANPKPIFLFKNVSVESVKQFGKEKNHYEIVITDGVKRVKGIKFFSSGANFDHDACSGDVIDLTGSIELSLFRGIKELRLRVEGIYQGNSISFE